MKQPRDPINILLVEVHYILAVAAWVLAVLSLIAGDVPSALFCAIVCPVKVVSATCWVYLLRWQEDRYP